MSLFSAAIDIFFMICVGGSFSFYLQAPIYLCLSFLFLEGFELDSAAALTYLLSRTDIDTNKIVIFGRSLGGAVAIALASNELYRDKAFALIVENTFTSIPSMANQLVMNGLSKLPYFCFRNKVM